MVMLELGVDKATLSKFSTLSLVCSVIFMFYIGKLNFTDNVTLFKKSYTLYYCYFIGQFLNFYYLYQTKNFGVFYAA